MLLQGWQVGHDHSAHVTAEPRHARLGQRRRVTDDVHLARREDTALERPESESESPKNRRLRSPGSAAALALVQPSGFSPISEERLDLGF